VAIATSTAINGRFAESIWLKECVMYMFVNHGEKDTSRDKTSNLDCCMIFSILWLNIKTKL